MKYRPTYCVYKLWIWKRLDIYNFFKDNIASILLKSPKEPPTQNRKMKFSELEESKN
jgi:hypothetical protein